MWYQICICGNSCYDYDGDSRAFFENHDKEVAYRAYEAAKTLCALYPDTWIELREDGRLIEEYNTFTD